MSVDLASIVLARGPKILVDDFSTVIGDESCVGIVGPNGCGKSTLLQAILGTVPLDSGEITFSAGSATVGYLPQMRVLPGDWTVRQVLRDRTGASRAEKRLEASARRLESDASDAAGIDFNDALNQFMSLGVDSLDARAPTVLADLGCEFSVDRVCTGLSGGELARVGLAAVLLSHFDVLLLDEPTNDLDAEGIRKLTDFVTSRTTPVLLVSHDRSFLEATVTSVVEFDPYLEVVSRFDGGYVAWENERAQARAAVMDENSRHEREVAALTAQIIAGKRRAQSGTRDAKRSYSTGSIDKLQRGAMIEGATAGAGSVRGIERKLERLTVPPQVRKVWRLEFGFMSPPARPAAFVLDQATATREDFVVGPLSCNVTPGQRIRICGRNGSGKSILLDVLAGTITISSGRASLPPAQEVGYLDQTCSVVPAGEDRLVEWFPVASGLEPLGSRTLLAKFGLRGDDVERPMYTLSPGERTRIGLALLTTQSFAALVLDEPTNHLDLPAIEQLEIALQSYTGTLLIATHDELFADRIRFDGSVELLRE